MMKLFLLAVLVSASMACSDRVTNCRNFNKARYCEHSYLRQNCQRYCGHCNDGCRDKYNSCAARYPNKAQWCPHPWLQQNCKNHCGLCGGVTTKRPTIPTSAPTPTPTNGGGGGSNGKCGRPAIAKGRVIGGTQAVAGSWPWQIAMYYNGRFGCGGSLVNEKWIVTAAHCVSGKRASGFKVRLGDHNRQQSEGHEQEIQVSRVVQHPGYKRLNNDIALLQLSRPVILNDRVHPVCLPQRGEKPAVGSECYITGWGKTRHPGTSANILMQLGLRITSKSDCQRMNGRFNTISDQMLCASNGANSGQSGCHGDSGGPFVCKQSDGSWNLHGAVSWGSPRCSSRESHTVFARVAEFRDWIDRYIN